MPKSYEATEGYTQEYRFLDVEDPAELLNILRPVIEGPGFDGSALAPTVAAMIQVDDLSGFAEPGECGLQSRVIRARSAV